MIILFLAWTAGAIVMACFMVFVGDVEEVGAVFVSLAWPVTLPFMLAIGLILGSIYGVGKILKVKQW